MLIQTLAGARPFADVDRLFNAAFQGFPFQNAQPAMTAPAINVWETEQGFVVESELPGVVMSDLEVSVIDDELTIKGHRQAAAHAEKSRVLRRERPAGHFARTITLPAPLDAEKVEASLVNGVLTIQLPKAAVARPRKIAITDNTK